MPLADIKTIVNQLIQINFKGTICFQIYNEPLIDPRLFWIIEYIKSQMMDIEVLVYTNGYYLTDSLAGDIQNGFADIIVATGYGRTEFERLVNLNLDIPYYVLYGNLDDRLIWDEELKKSKCNVPCASLFSQVPIWANGDVGLCCMDCFQKVKFGNIKKTELKQILDAPEIEINMKCLLSGNRRSVGYCSSCEWEGISI